MEGDLQGENPGTVSAYRKGGDVAVSSHDLIVLDIELV